MNVRSAKIISCHNGTYSLTRASRRPCPSCSSKMVTPWQIRGLALDKQDMPFAQSSLTWTTVAVMELGMWKTIRKGLWNLQIWHSACVWKFPIGCCPWKLGSISYMSLKRRSFGISTFWTAKVCFWAGHVSSKADSTMWIATCKCASAKFLRPLATNMTMLRLKRFANRQSHCGSGKIWWFSDASHWLMHETTLGKKGLCYWKLDHANIKKNWVWSTVPGAYCVFVSWRDFIR